MLTSLNGPENASEVIVDYNRVRGVQSSLLYCVYGECGRVPTSSVLRVPVDCCTTSDSVYFGIP